MTNFEGITAKIKRAEAQINSLNSDMEWFCEDTRKSIVHEVRKTAEEQVWVFRGATPDVPIEWSIRLGEILYNLRSSLDHLVWQLVLANGQEPGRHNQFPIVKDESGWQKATSKPNVLEGMHPDAQLTVERLQSYTVGGNFPFDVSALWTLHSLCNIDKHRHLNLTTVASYGPNKISIEKRDGSPKLEVEIRFPDKTADLPPIGHVGIALPSQFTDFEDPEDIRLRPWASAPIREIEEGKVLLHLNNAGVEVASNFQIDIRFEDIENYGVGAVPRTLHKCFKAVQGATELLLRHRE